ncbi:carbon-nitrogen hydrolase family protein [Aureivirga marina]|uniref:carbon-nitrogen hydrolase family protein n=1 Tax=Aureivirga marina TaxID=1182451 RepID=UPI0018C96888|nr:carbon-nitrogen hydrolase family protein [Aureivirga marina]
MKVRVAVVQDSPIFFDKEKTIQKVRDIITENADKKCELFVFPETFIPGYPRGFDFATKIGNRKVEGKKLYAKYHSESVDLESKDILLLEEISKEFNTFIVIGITEKNNINGSLFCSMVYISPEIGFMGVHRKIKPTGTERLIWAESDGSSFVTFDTKIGKLGGLICWENYMPLARMAMYQKGIQIYIAPTADAREDWINTMKHIALEGRCFVLGCNQYFRKDMYPEEFQKHMKDIPNNFCEGGSVIISPYGRILEGPVFGENKVLIAELDLNEIIETKLDFDVIGHYNRSDIFEFKVNKQPEIKKI